MNSRSNPPRVTRECKGCGKPFQPPMRDVNRGFGWFCSRACSQKHKSHPEYGARITANCSYCGAPIIRLSSRASKSKSGLLFCQRSCKDSAQRLESGIASIRPPHYGTAVGAIDAETYRNLAFRHHPARCNRCGYDRHKSVLRVHHRDRDRANRNPRNLEILCPTCHEEDHYLNGDGVYARNKSGGGCRIPTDLKVLIASETATASSPIPRERHLLL
jgi:hypothetical protein